MYFAQLYTPGLAHCSYVIGSGDECMVVDPSRYIEPYLEKAEEFGMEITAVLETHLHADFISGHMELADKTGAIIYAARIFDADFPHHALEDEEEFAIGNLRCKLLETPGHTPDCTVCVVTDLERGEEPVLVFTGDTLLVGDAGRPDLFPDREEELAGKLFHSLERLKELPDQVEVYPAHGMGSLCGRDLSAKLWSTVGTERRYNYALQYTDQESFKRDMLEGMPPAPDHYARCTEINRKGPVLIDDLEEPRPFNALELSEALEENYTVIDTRTFHSFAAVHIPGSYSISKDGNLPTYAGWVIPPEDKLVLVLENENDLEEVKRNLHHVGLDNITGFLEGSIEEWLKAGRPVRTIRTISVHQLRYWMSKESPVVLDNRSDSEWAEGHIEGAIHVPAPDLRHRYTEWDPKKPIVVHCNTSIRSMTAASILKQKGFKYVINVLGGTTAWEAAGFPLQPGQ